VIGYSKLTASAWSQTMLRGSDTGSALNLYSFELMQCFERRQVRTLSSTWSSTWIKSS